VADLEAKKKSDREIQIAPNNIIILIIALNIYQSRCTLDWYG